MSTRKYLRVLIPTAIGLAAAAGLYALDSVWAQRPTGSKGTKKASKSAGKAAEQGKPSECEMSDEVRKQVLAKVGSSVITVGSFADEINKKSPYLRARYESLERRKDLLQSLVRRELLAAEAAERGLDKNEDVQRSMKQVMIQKLLNKVFEERVKKEGIPEKELKAFYKDHFKEYNKPEQVRISHILVKDQKKAKEILAEAKKKGGNMRNWRQLVRKHSEDRATKVRGGDLRYFPKDTDKIAKPVVEAAFNLKKPGQIAGLVKTKEGYHIIRLTHRRKAFERSFEEVKDQIRQRILRHKRSKVIKDFVDELRNKAKVEIKDEELKTLNVDTRTPIRRRGRGKRRGMRLRRGRRRRGRRMRGRRRRGRRKRIKVRRGGRPAARPEPRK